MNAFEVLKLIAETQFETHGGELIGVNSGFTISIQDSSVQVTDEEGNVYFFSLS